MLGGAQLAAAHNTFGLSHGGRDHHRGEPEADIAGTVRRAARRRLRRVWLGMQIAPRVLAVLDRVHSPGRAVAAAREARRPVSTAPTST